MEIPSPKKWCLMTTDDPRREAVSWGDRPLSQRLWWGPRAPSVALCSTAGLSFQRGERVWGGSSPVGKTPGAKEYKTGWVPFTSRISLTMQVPRLEVELRHPPAAFNGSLKCRVWRHRYSFQSTAGCFVRSRNSSLSSHSTGGRVRLVSRKRSVRASQGAVIQAQFRKGTGFG